MKRNNQNGQFVQEPLVDSFMKFVNKQGPPHPYNPSLGNCWMWTGCVFGKGTNFVRARMTWGGRDTRAARISYEIFKGQLGNLFACHSCDNPLCVNPDHLWAGTTQDNTRDCIAKGRNRKRGPIRNFDGYARTKGSNHYTNRHPELRTHGEAHGQSKLTKDAVLFIRSRTMGNKALAGKFQVSVSAIKKVLAGKSWGHL